ncbi:peptide deformylase [Brachybacterium sp. J153]|uniref:peptide deformylase n=1 Tax=Brachybacterium sp. J153 TaxID=3116488 RepID=UPI002E77758B|nr:peptide deformylase [Brachybacterium sp. J153]MEE1617329.1 peptide deformylase [Brachybacterium sp. J153]
MSVRPIRLVGDPVLRTPCDPIRSVTDATRRLVRDLEDTVDDEARAGVAANQIGVSLRAFSWHLPTHTQRVGHILNPVIVELSDELQHDDEGCLSVPGLFFPRTRSAFARCVGTDVDGAEIELAGEGIIARLIQHEVAHLDGELYIDGLERSVKKKALRQIRETL